ncbi:MAG: paraquat-inducible protein A [Deltaproteobacteria bacterium]|nr:paraquat-inducible protein A [Deltaproteobacteria bacterium]
MSSLIACHDCDLIQRLPHISEAGTIQCIRCGAVLHQKIRNSIERTLSLTLAGLVLFGLANTFPFLAFKIGAQVRQTTLLTGIQELYAQGMPELSVIVLLTTVLVPFAQMICMLYILLPLKFRRIPIKLPQVFRFIRHLQPWNMMEVFMLGILVSVVKLAKMAQIIPGVALFSFLALIFVMAAMTASLDSHLIWEKWDEKR